jgi:hypothetical protein
MQSQMLVMQQWMRQIQRASLNPMLVAPPAWMFEGRYN